MIQSEKKYKTKQAQEYRNYLSKLQNASTTTTALAVADETVSQGLETKWESSSGLDDMMTALSQKSDNSTISSKSMPVPELPRAEFSFAESQPPKIATEPTKPVSLPVPTASEVLPPPAPLPAPAPVVLGTLSVSEIKSDKDTGLESQFESKVPMKIIGKSTFKKAVPAKSSRMISSSALDLTFESFDSVDKRAALVTSAAAAGSEAFKVIGQPMSTSANNSGSGRVASIYKDSQGPSASIYSTPIAPSTYSSAKTQGTSGSSSFNPAAAESYQARSKYAGNKGISSDQFFGRDEEDMELMKNRISKLGNASAIGSDMLSSDDQGEWRASDHLGQGNKYASEDNSIEQLKNSVVDFLNGSWVE